MAHPLEQIANATMPFGQYKGRRLVDLPEPYLVWFKSQGWPRGLLGQQLELALEIKHNGLTHLLDGLAQRT